MRDDASWHMKGLTAKYTLEFRRPFPELRNAKCLDRWSTVPLALLIARLEDNEGLKAKLEAVTGDAFQVPDSHIECRHEEKHLGVLRERFATSLFVSSGDAFAQLTGKRATGSTSQSVDGDGSSVCAMRRVVAVTFPRLCSYVRDIFSATELETAWFWNCGLYATVVVGRTCATYESKQHDNENSSNDNNNNNDDNNK